MAPKKPAAKNQMVKAPTGEVDLYAHAGSRVDKSVEEQNTKSGGGWGFLKLVQPTTKAQDLIKGCQPGDFILGGSTLIKGGEDPDQGFVGVPVANRARATLWGRDASGAPTGEMLEESMDPTSDAYAAIRSKRGDFGLEFLIWLPLFKQFAVAAFTKPTSRPMGAVCNDAMDNRQVVQVNTKMVSNKKGRFAVMLVEAKDAKGKMEMPEAAVFEAVVKDFSTKAEQKDAPANARPR